MTWIGGWKQKVSAKNIDFFRKGYSITLMQ